MDVFFFQNSNALLTLAQVSAARSWLNSLVWASPSPSLSSSPSTSTSSTSTSISTPTSPSSSSTYTSTPSSSSSRASLPVPSPISISPPHRQSMPPSVVLHASAPPDDVDDSEACVVCVEREKNTALIPCGHRAFCAECAQLLLSKKSVCPLCRLPIQSVLKVYLG
eukprot:TRINITY_DN17772_c0_g1_i1.p1 TRINITY_DN17772_c0_g1~~TRINITY_DN17772_c0_g1_i1.p1  ORF type:complete len:166 (-),score=34.59 TRINITY_DN17772_c0_g1_i1:158-655(-)